MVRVYKGNYGVEDEGIGGKVKKVISERQWRSEVKGKGIRR